jgi:hypothetical protein
MSRYRVFPTIVMAALILLPAFVSAQDGPMPLTWVGMDTVKPGKGMQYPALFAKYNKPLLDQMVADGSAMGWGVGYELAGPGGFNYLVWITMPGWAGMGAVEAAFDAHYEGMSEAEREAMMAEWEEVMEIGQEQHMLLRHTVFNASPDAKYNYLRLSNYTVNPGYDGDVQKMYKSFVAPVYDQLLKDGAIAGYGLIEQAIHSDSTFTHESWITFDELADLEKVEKAFKAQDVSDGDQVARDLAFKKMFQSDAHYDRLIRVIMQND